MGDGATREMGQIDQQKIEVEKMKRIFVASAAF